MPTKECLNTSDNSTYHTIDLSRQCVLFDFGVYTIFVGSSCCLGIIGNAISFLVLLRDSARSVTTVLLQALAVADSLVLITAAPLYSLSPVYYYTGFLKTYSERYASIMPFLWPLYLTAYTGTIWLTVLVSLNRYEAVCRPFKAGKLCGDGGGKVRRHVVYVVLFSVLYNIPRFFEYSTTEVCVGYNASSEIFGFSEFGRNRLYRIVYTNVLYFLVMHGGPLVSLAFLNANLIRALKVQARKRTEMKLPGYQQDITLVLVVVVCVFICCQTPTFVDHVLWTVVDTSTTSCGHWHYYYTAIGDMMAVLNSAVNFVIYVLTSPKFRQNLVTMCGCVSSACVSSRRKTNLKSEAILLCPATARNFHGDTV